MNASASFPGRYTDQVAIVTGGAEGLGKAIARRLGAEGASLALFDRNTDLLNSTVDELMALNSNVRPYSVDISQEEQVKKAIEQVVADFGKIDVVVHSAGIVGPTSTNITAYATADFEQVCAVNLLGSFLMTKYAVTHMAPQRYGRILLIASIAGKEGNPGMVGYSVSKAGVIGLVKAIAKEYATAGITINGLAPAVIRTAMNANTATEQLAYMTAKIPMGRLGEAEEVAAMASFIVSPENSFSTGFIYDISGGRATY
ncbi:SDR family NAD(P)-dependent oxidoreductase [Spirosoma endophyticum]|uniref:3-oxoacyl-[acyl-carrier protein] reductase n=1 Tax=Spirosoma endophyticum TaxID=662367 RepID=A0A1I1FUJ1_9BACT|nr:SDR family NAD(P)-dependent oxidoreductase [Spirosoma endophyticum]SFC02712.1 3-oxoacyl-[acyl-carrier protein] reductase [Spirosoma endophyticum]